MKQFIPGRGKRDTNDTKVNLLWTVSTVFPSLAERKKNCTGGYLWLRRSTWFDKPFWLAKGFDLHGISTAASEGHSDPEETQTAVRFTTFDMVCQTKWQFTLKFRGVCRNQTHFNIKNATFHNDIRAMKAQLWWQVPQTVLNYTKYCTRIENSNENWHTLQTLSQKNKRVK